MASLAQRALCKTQVDLSWYQRQARAHGILNNRIYVTLIGSRCLLDDLSPTLSYSTETFGEVANGKVQHPNGRQTLVRTACMPDSRRGVPITAEHLVVGVALACVLHLNVLRRPANHRLVEVAGCRGVGDRQVKPRDVTDARHTVAGRGAISWGGLVLRKDWNHPESRPIWVEEHRPLALSIVALAMQHLAPAQIERPFHT